MPVTDLMMEGVQLMVLGMGIVFTFLVVLVGAMTAMSRIGMTLEKEAPKSAGITTAPVRSVAQTDDTLIAVISASVKMYRDSRQ